MIDESIWFYLTDSLGWIKPTNKIDLRYNELTKKAWYRPIAYEKYSKII